MWGLWCSTGRLHCVGALKATVSTSRFTISHSSNQTRSHQIWARAWSTKTQPPTSAPYHSEHFKTCRCVSHTAVPAFPSFAFLMFCLPLSDLLSFACVCLWWNKHFSCRACLRFPKMQISDLPISLTSNNASISLFFLCAVDCACVHMFIDAFCLHAMCVSPCIRVLRHQRHTALNACACLPVCVCVLVCVYIRPVYFLWCRQRFQCARQKGELRAWDRM